LEKKRQAINSKMLAETDEAQTNELKAQLQTLILEFQQTIEFRVEMI